MYRVAIVGLGNIGRFAIDAVNDAPDMELAGVVRRKAGEKEVRGVPIVENVGELGKVDVVLLCTPSRSVEDTAVTYLLKGIATVDSYDVHSKINGLRENLDKAAKAGNCAAVVSAGWDPGSNSIVRALLEACAPKGITYTNFGPGMSMGHTVVVKSKKGVAGALSMTIPTGTGVHRRMVYVQLELSAKLEDVAADIKADPYFSSDETHVIAVKDVSRLIDMGHGVNMVRKGVSGATHNQIFEFSMKINNPAVTSQIMVSCVRAAMRQKPGAYTMIEIPVVDFLPGDREHWVAKLV
ncbi:MAG: diaminopimelate dehydrogenase [Defluviitaleaceae bacterium]|nr:diaminopimelate dehydrogenase [Defluviitaleaceae bacterium]